MRINVKEVEIQDRHLVLDFNQVEKKYELNMDNKRNWKARCDECNGVMDYYNLAYICRKCGNVLEV